MKGIRVAAFVLAGGEGARLRPFTDNCPKPALPFGARHRIVDFVLSNLFNSGLRQVCLLTQYRPLLLARHLTGHWGGTFTQTGAFVRIVLPGMTGAAAFRGTADAVARSLRVVGPETPDVIAVFAADHVFRMDVRQMIEFHLDSGADATIAAVPVPIERASRFGVIGAEADGRIRAFQEKPSQPVGIAGDAGRALASMGNYVFRPEALEEALAWAQMQGRHDFGFDVLPYLAARHRSFAYDFGRNRVPGERPGTEPAYWRDVGNVDGYVDAQLDTLGPTPRFVLENPEWPLRAPRAAAAARAPTRATAPDLIVGPETDFRDARLRSCVLQRGAQVEPDAELDRCVIMEGARVASGVRLSNALIGSGSIVTRTGPRRRGIVAAPRGCFRTPAGLLVVPPHTVADAARLAVA
jgi:glucose-1-phosphate adenylyltransferase